MYIRPSVTTTLSRKTMREANHPLATVIIGFPGKTPSSYKNDKKAQEYKKSFDAKQSNSLKIIKTILAQSELQ
jgi:radical SAM superfamily enzyme YgiQ (UPF0313 family)